MIRQQTPPSNPPPPLRVRIKYMLIGSAVTLLVVGVWYIVSIYLRSDDWQYAKEGLKRMRDKD